MRKKNIKREKMKHIQIRPDSFPIFPTFPNGNIQTYSQKRPKENKKRNENGNENDKRYSSPR